MSAREDFLQAMALWASSVALVTTDGPKGRAGITVSSLCSVTADDPALLVCIHRASRAGDVIAGNRAFCVHLLRDDQAPVSELFAGRMGPDAERFGAGGWTRMATGAPVMEDHMAALDCRLVKEDAWGTHRLFIGEVAGTSLGAGEALIRVKRHYAKAAELAAAV